MTPGAGVTIRPELGQGYLEIDVMALTQGYVWARIMPIATMEREGGVYPKVKLASLLPKVTLDMLRRGADGSYARSKWEYESDSFATVEYGLEEPVDDRSARILRYHGLQADQIAADRSTSSLMRAIEINACSLIQGTHADLNLSAQTTAVTNEWDDPTNATPINDIKAAQERFEARNGGMSPRLLTLSLKQARNVLLCDQIQAVLGYRPSEGLSQEQLQGNALMIRRFESILAMVLGVPEVAIADGFANSKLPGVAGSYSRIWSDEYVSLLTPMSPGQDLKQPGFGRHMFWTGDGGGSGQTMSIEDYYDVVKRGRVIRSRVDMEPKVVHSELVEVLSNITT